MNSCRLKPDRTIDLRREACSRRRFDCAHATRRGALLVEMVVCTILLSVVASILVPGIHAVHEQRKAARYDSMVLVELNNQTALIHESGAAADAQLSDWFQQRYPAAKLTAESIAEADDDDDLAAIRLTIVRPTVDAQPDVNRSLVVWVTKKEAAE